MCIYSEATEQQVELLQESHKIRQLKNTYNCAPMNQANRLRKTKVGNPSEILENH